jgi:DNA polymerase III delta subunit
VKYYEFIDRVPPIPRIVFVEGTERVFADRAIAKLQERLLEPFERDLNLDVIDATEGEALRSIGSAISALPFLAKTRMIVAKRTHEMRAQPRRDFWAVAQQTPEGNVLVIEDLVAVSSKRPEPLSKGAGRSALRIDTTASRDARERYISEEMGALGVTAEPAVLATLASGSSDLIAVRTDLEKLALLGRKITLEDVLRESLVTDDAKAYQFASLLVEGKRAQAYALADDMLAGDRNAMMAILSSLAREYLALWELSRPNGGQVEKMMAWRAAKLRPIAIRMGPRRARLGFERAVKGMEAIVTGRAEDPRTLLAQIAAAAER